MIYLSFTHKPFFLDAEGAQCLHCERDLVSSNHRLSAALAAQEETKECK